MSNLPFDGDFYAGPEWGEQLKCSVCGDSYVHTESVENSGPQDNYESGWVRGSTTKITFWCENGGHTFSLEFGFHKGFTFLRLHPETGVKVWDK